VPAVPRSNSTVGRAGEGAIVKFVSVFVSSVVMIVALPVLAQEIALMAGKQDCATDEPDSVQISWTEPCDSGTWLFEPGVGCRMWDWHPDPGDKATWSGSCRGVLKEGYGVMQWTEHGQPIDRFEGVYRNGRREGLGRYSWNATDRFEGTYVNDVPNGFGTAHLAGETLSGEWRKGCLAVDGKVVAIGVARASCPEQTPEAAATN